MSTVVAPEVASIESVQQEQKNAPTVSVADSGGDGDVVPKTDERDYLLSQNPTEVERLSYQHEIVKDFMGGKLVLAPMDLSKQDLHILDTATADGVPPFLPFRSPLPLGSPLTHYSRPTSRPLAPGSPIFPSRKHHKHLHRHRHRPRLLPFPATPAHNPHPPINHNALSLDLALALRPCTPAPRAAGLQAVPDALGRAFTHRARQTRRLDPAARGGPLGPDVRGRGNAGCVPVD